MGGEKYGRALYDFRGAQEGDLGFQEDDIILVLEQDDSGWWVGEHCTDGRRGEFPFNYVELITEEEAMRAERARNQRKPSRAGAGAGGGGVSGGDGQFQFRGDRITNLRVSGTESGRKMKFKIDCITQSQKKRSTTKSLSQFRKLDVQLRKLVPSFERVLPPVWCDGAKLGKEDTRKREKVLESYLTKFIGIEATDFLLLSWLFPGERVELSQSGSKEVMDVARETAKAGSDNRQSVANTKVDIPTLAYVEFTWTPQDEVELLMHEGQIIEVLSQSTGSPGWWEGRTVDGCIGLFPYNHVELLDRRVAQAVCNGTSLSKAQQVKYNDAAGGYAQTGKSAARKSMNRISLGLFGGGSGKAGSKNKGGSKPTRSRKIVKPFYIQTTESFDCLIDNGFTMEQPNGKFIPIQVPKNAPQKGDFVRLSYVAYTFDAQQQALIEFSASDYPGEKMEPGPLEFFVGRKGEVIKGVDYAVQRMCQGMQCRLIVTPQLAYGAVGSPPDIPPHTHIVYDLTLDAFGNEDTVEMDDVPPPPPEETTRKFGSNKPPKPSGSAGGSRPSMGGGMSRPPKPSLAKPKKPTFQPPPSPSSSQYGGSSAGSTFSNNSGFVPPKGKEMSLKDAIALRRQKLAQQESSGQSGFVADRTNHRNNAQYGGFAGQQNRVQVDQSGNRKSFRVPVPEQPQVSQKYGLNELQRFVREKQLRAKGIDPSNIEEYLQDGEFSKAFKMSKGEFLLLPKWKRQALKRGLGLF